jgi:arsenate reductase
MHTRNVLILCTGNSCRSIIAEVLINAELGESWKAFSAGVSPQEVNPRALEILQQNGFGIENLRSKSVEEFLDRQNLHLIITVCDNARESCPVFPGIIPLIHIGIEDPAPFTEAPDSIAIPKFQEVLDDIKVKVLKFISEY